MVSVSYFGQCWGSLSIYSDILPVFKGTLDALRRSRGVHEVGRVLVRMSRNAGLISVGPNWRLNRYYSRYANRASISIYVQFVNGC